MTPSSAQQLGRLASDGDAGAHADERHVGALLEHQAAPHLERRDLLERREGRGEAARVAERRRSVQRERRGQHALELLLAGRGHQGHARDDAQEREVEGAVVRGPVVADEARPVDGEGHRQVLQPDVLHEHVERPLQERRVQRHDRPHAADGEAGGEHGGVLLRDADVVEAVGEPPLERLEPRALRHRRRDRHDALVAFGQTHERLAEGVRVRRADRRGLARPVADVERPGPVIGVGPGLRGLVALALDRLDVDDDRPARVDRLADALAQRVHVVPVHHADVREAQLLEEHAGHEERLHRLLDVLAQPVRLAADRGDLGDALLEVLAQAGQGRVEPDAVEIELQGADVGADGHLVVVDDDDQRRVQVPGLVERLEGDAAGERAVAQDADDVAAVATRDAPRLDEPQPVADRRRGVAGAGDVVRRLGAAREPREPPVLPDRAEPLAAAGEQLVRVALMPDVPDDLVARTLEHAVQRDRELHGAETGGEVAAGLADAREDGLADLVGEQREFTLGELSEVGGV